MKKDLIKINDMLIENRHIKWGSFSVKQAKRMIGNWTDGNGITHYEYFPTPKATITFTLNERSPETQKELESAFEELADVKVEYYDTVSDSYKIGNFRMTEPEFKQVLNGNIVWYADTKITLTEY